MDTHKVIALARKNVNATPANESSARFCLEDAVITTIKLDMVQRIVDTGLETEEELDWLKALLNVNSKDDMIAWFDNHYNYFSFNLQVVTVNA